MRYANWVMVIALAAFVGCGEEDSSPTLPTPGPGGMMGGGGSALPIGGTSGGGGSAGGVGQCAPDGQSCQRGDQCCGTVCVGDGQGGGVCTSACNSGAQCSTGCCAPLEGGGGACAPAQFCEGGQCTPDGQSCQRNDECCGDVCLNLGQSVVCTRSCTSSGQCPSGCCAALEGGGGACAPAQFCG